VSDGVTALMQFAHHDYSWLVQFFSLLFLPFAHEDLAIILGAYVVVNNIMPVGLVALCIYGGMVASDFALYGIGAGARRLPWLARLAVDARVRGLGDVLGRSLFGLMALWTGFPQTPLRSDLPPLRRPLGLYTCVDWRHTTAAGRYDLVQRLRAWTGGPIGGDRLLGYGTVLPDAQAAAMFDARCRPAWARGFSLYKQYGYAAAFSGIAP